MLVLSACFLFGVMGAQQGSRIERERVGQREGRGRFPELMERFGQRFPSEPSFFPPNSRQRLSGLGFRSRQSRQQSVELVGFTGGAIYDVFVKNNYAYCASGSGLLIFNVSNPSNPQLVGKLLLPDFALGVYVSGNYAYVADEGAGLRVIDVSNPTNPREIGFFDTPGNARGVYVSGNYAYVADGRSGLRVIDVSNPTNPREVGYFDTPGYAYDVYVSGNYAYVAAERAGLFILRFTGAQPVNHPPSIPVLLSPANNATVSPVPTFKLKSDDPDNDQVMFIMEVKQGSILKSFQTGFYSSGVEVTYSDSRQPLSDGQWQWRAKARDKRGAESGWSEWKTFTVQSNLPDLVPIDLKVTPEIQ